MMPITFSTRMNMNSENTSGKNFMPSVPAVLRSVFATNSYDISATDCSRPGASLGERPNSLLRTGRVQCVARYDPCRAHHVENPGSEAEEQKHYHSPRRNSEPAIKQP